MLKQMIHSSPLAPTNTRSIHGPGVGSVCCVPNLIRIDVTLFDQLTSKIVHNFNTLLISIQLLCESIKPLFDELTLFQIHALVNSKCRVQPVFLQMKKKGNLYIIRISGGWSDGIHVETDWTVTYLFVDPALYNVGISVELVEW